VPAIPVPDAMSLAVPLTLEPMEAQPVDELPAGPSWHYEPKWDGYRCLAFRDGSKVRLTSRKGKDLGRYFPELIAALAALNVPRFVIDGEIVIRKESFETLQLRLHPAKSRIDELARTTPATIVAFDLLADDRGRSLLEQPFADRRRALTSFMAKVGKRRELILSRATRSRARALKWLEGVGHGLDGIVAKRCDLAYQPGSRAMQKYKIWKTVDCVVGGIYRAPGSQAVDSLLLGLYDEDGKLHYVGRHRVTKGGNALARTLAPLVGGSGFTGRAPAEVNRWSDKRNKAVPLEPRLVAEVSADHITSKFFRHGARLVRWRDDKRPESCTLDQI
jgi:ATP-dependent DNA ligase